MFFNTTRVFFVNNLTQGDFDEQELITISTDWLSFFTKPDTIK